MQSESATMSTELANDPNIVNENDNSKNLVTTEKEDCNEINSLQCNEEASRHQANLENPVRAATPKQCRELKSILELSKEANLNTNIIHKRKSTEPTGRCLDKECSSKSSAKTNSDSDESNNEDKVIKEKQTPNSRLGKRKKDDLTNTGIDGVVEEQKRSKKLLNNSIIMRNNQKKDPFCWICHHEGVAIFCETCPRSFHQKCIRQNALQLAHWICPECVIILKAENIKQRSPAMRHMTLEHLCGLLKFALKRMSQIENCEPFIHPVNENEFPEYKNHVVQPMTLTCLEKNIKSNIYGSPQAFEADAKWVLHNSIIFNSNQAKLTSIAKSMVKICKQEMSEIENCPTCYLNANTKKDTWFIEVCPKPHLLVWAKLKGFPYWPAKAMRTNSLGMVDVRFFGAHDRAWVPFKECFLFSLKDPNSNKQKRNDINESLKELQCHIENLIKVYGKFNYASYRLPLEPKEELKQLQLLLPKYNPDESPKVMDINKSPRNNCANSETSESETENSETSLDKEVVDDKMECEEQKSSSSSDEDLESNKTATSNISARVSPNNLGGDNKNKVINNIKRPSSSTEDEPPPKLSRRSSDCSVRSSVSDKASKPDSLECFDKEDSTENILSNLLNNDVSVNDDDKHKINSEANEPVQKSTIADLLMKKLSERIEQLKTPTETSSNDSVKVKTISTDQSIVLEKENVVETSVTKIPEINVNEVLAEITSSNELASSKKVETSKLPINQGCMNNDNDSFNKTNENVDEMSTNSSNITTEIKNLTDEKLNENKSEIMLNDENNVSLDHTAEAKQKDAQNMQITSSSKCEIYKINTKSKPNENYKPKKQFIKIVDVNEIKGKSSNHVINDKQIDQPKPFINSYLDFKANEDDNLEDNQNEDVTEMSDMDLHSIVVKSEPSSEDEFESEYDQKRKYLSALNISERLPDKPKLNEIKVISKENLKRFEIVDNITKVIDDVAKDCNSHVKTKYTNMINALKKKEIFIKPLSNMQMPTQKARKSFPLPSIKTTSPMVVQKLDVLKTSKSLITPITSSSVQKSNLVAFVTKTSDSLTTTSNIMFLTQTPSTTSGGLTLLPPSQSISYPTNTSNPILTMVHHPAVNNVYVQQASLPISTVSPINPILGRTEKPSESQNFIPLSGDSLSKSTLKTISQTVPTKTTNVIIPVTSNSSTLPPLVPVNFDNVSPAVIGQQNESLEKLQTLTAFSPGNLVKAVNDVMCRPPPKLTPKPPGLLGTPTEEGAPSTAGPVVSQVNSISQRLTDHFREMFTEFLNEMGKRSCPEAKIASLQLQLEVQNHKHTEEISEMKKNMDMLLKDLEKSWEGERKRLIEEVRNTCQTENQKNLEEAKSKQWCANCSKEAQFYCCWNTSYCDYPCQQKHWSKHMSNCTQNAQGFQQPPASTANSTTKVPNQPIVLRQTAPPKGFTAKALIAKPTKVYVTKSNNKNALSFVKSTTGNHITLVQAAQGNYEVVGNGVPLPAGKFITNLGKVKSGNLIAVSSSSSASTSLLTGSGQKTVRIAQVKQASTSNPPPLEFISNEECN